MEAETMVNNNPLTEAELNEWVPIRYLETFDVIIGRWPNKEYKSTEDSGKTWRKATEEEIKECGF